MSEIQHGQMRCLMDQERTEALADTQFSPNCRSRLGESVPVHSGGNRRDGARPSPTDGPPVVVSPYIIKGIPKRKSISEDSIPNGTLKNLPLKLT
ncbi:hypothetical protein Trydic_g16212 [Trypoxylus dichotomus]